MIFSFIWLTQKKVTRDIIFSFNLDDVHENFGEAMSSRDTHLWKEFINDEMDSIIGNETCELVDIIR